ncbi:MAG: transposase [Gammaproteobacteria bacterium]|nr:transposase [Gammaproteobacteria bacterium]
MSDDNPYSVTAPALLSPASLPSSESLFHTVKYAPVYPGHFSTVEDARDYFETFVHRYHHEHRHSGLRFVTPAQRHEGKEAAILAQRHPVYEQAKQRFPQRWNGRATHWDRIATVHLNPEKGKSHNSAMAVAA